MTGPRSSASSAPAAALRLPVDLAVGRAVGLALVLAAGTAAPVLADELAYDCAVDAKSSTLTQTTSATAPFAGTFKGNYDATTNPTGTRTLPGYFGGSGNNPIPYVASFVVDGEIVTSPTGTLRLGVDLESLTVRVTGLALDFLGGEPAELGATVNINYQTFHTVSPSSIYPGGVNIPVPVGSAVISELTAAQTGGGVFGALIPQKDGSFQFTAAVPVEYTLVASALGQPIGDGAPVAAVLPMTGRLVVGADGIALTLDVEGGDSIDQPLELDPFVDQAFALPTVLPPGGTANLLLSGDVTSIALDTTIVATIVIDGVRAAVPGDVNGDGAVDAFDLAAVLSSWGSTGGPGDVNGDGVIDAADLAIVLSNWG